MTDNNTYTRIRKEFDSPEFRRILKAEKGNACTYCGSTKNIEYHHIVQVSQGGDNRLNNIIPLCNKCHKKAHGKQPIKGKKYKPTGRHRIERPGNYEEVMSLYFRDQVSMLTALELMDIKRHTFYRFREEYIKEHHMRPFRSTKGCERNGGKR